MVGLVNSAGAYAAGREQAAQSTRPATATTHDVGEPPMWIRPYEADDRNRSTADAVPATPPQAEAAAELPAADPAHEAARQEGAGTPGTGLGELIDVTG